MLFRSQIALTSMNVFRETILAMQMPLAKTTKEITRVHATQDSRAMEQIALTSMNVFRETIPATEMPLARTTMEFTRVHATQDSRVMEQIALI